MNFDEFGFRAAAEKAGYKRSEIDAVVNQIKEQQKAQSVQALIQSGVLNVGDVAKSDPLAAAQAIETGAKPVPKLSEEEKKIARGKENASRIIDQLEELYFRGEGNQDDLSYGNKWLRIPGLWGEITKLAGYNEPLSTYEATRASVRPTLAKAGGSDSQLSEPEQIAAIKQLPTGFSTNEEAVAGFKEIRKRLGLLKDIPLNQTSKKSGRFTYEIEN